VGPRLALALISELGAERVVRAIRERDLTLLSSVSGIGRKKAERLALELADRLDSVSLPAAAAPSGNADAVRALMALGYTAVEADDAVRLASREVALEDTPHLIRRALASLAVARTGR
jgi:Holliday junction DNA helicase RuvA